MSMPPTRTIPPVKAIKTERTHEENQERAYIAASRRSDRSLEARVESARRASEIHKRRTGRSLRVTEQDVINEEMYEEEDDDLPMQYRRLTAHLQTGSADFNRRLAAYLTNQVAMRSVMGQMANNPYGQQFPSDMSQFAYPTSNMFQSPMMPRGQIPQSPGGSYRTSPYPSPHHPNFRHGHGRSYSTAVIPHEMQSPSTPGSGHPLDHRRMSTPATIRPQLDTNAASPDSDYSRQTQSAQFQNATFPPPWQDMGPFTTSLPPESQQMLAGAPALDPNDPFSAALMQGSENVMNNPYYPWGNTQQEGIKGMPVHPSAYRGMSATLAPPAMTDKVESLTATSTTAANPGADATAPSTGISGLGMDQSLDMGDGDHSPLSMQSGQATPGENFWDTFVQDGGWNDDNTAGN